MSTVVVPVVSSLSFALRLRDILVSFLLFTDLFMVWLIFSLDNSLWCTET